MQNRPGSPSHVPPVQAWDGPSGLRQTIEAAPVGIAQFDEMGRFLLANERLCAIFGYPRHELLGLTFQEITFPDDLAGCLKRNSELAAGLVPRYQQEKRFVRRDGTTIWVRVTVSAVRAEGGLVLFFIGIAEDVNQEYLERERRAAAEARLEAALRASVTGTFLWDIQTGEVAWDANLYRLMGLEPREEIQEVESSMSQVHADDRAALGAAVAQCGENGGRFHQDFRVVWPDGSFHCLRCLGDTICSPEGQPLRMTGAVTDVTDLWQSQRELKDVVAQLTGLLDRGNSRHRSG